MTVSHRAILAGVAAVVAIARVAVLVAAHDRPGHVHHQAAALQHVEVALNLNENCTGLAQHFEWKSLLEP